MNVARPCAVCQKLPTLRESAPPFVEFETSSGAVVRLWLCSPECAWSAGILSARLVPPVDLLKVQKLFRGNGVEVLR